MTPEHAKALLPIITACSEGKTIQYRRRKDSRWIDLTSEAVSPSFTRPPEDYRIKPALHPDISFSPDGYLLPPRVGEWASKHPLTEAGIPEGHRPYVKGELLRKGDPTTFFPGIIQGDLAGCVATVSDYSCFTLAPLPEPKLVPLTSEELPPVVWVRNKEKQRLRHALLITTWNMETGSFWYKVENGSVQIEPERFHEWEYSSDRKTWHSLMKEVQA